MKRIGGRRVEIEAFIEGARFVVFRVCGGGPDAGDVGRPEGAQQGVFEQVRADPLA